MAYYKLTRPDGWDFHTGETINYREALGGRVEAPSRRDWGPELCSPGVLHASKNPLDCFVGAKIPCAAFIVEGRPVARDDRKAGFRSLRVVEEVTDLDALFGFNYTEAANPVNPLARKRKPTEADLALLRVWASVGDSAWASVGDSAWASDSVWASVSASVGASAWNSVRASVWASVRASAWDSVGDSAWASVRDSVADSVWAYIGSLFPGVTDWKHIDHEPGTYPFQSGADLWRKGLVPSFDRKLWRLHSGAKAEIVWSGTREALEGSE